MEGKCFIIITIYVSLVQGSKPPMNGGEQDPGTGGTQVVTNQDILGAPAIDIEEQHNGMLTSRFGIPPSDPVMYPNVDYVNRQKRGHLFRRGKSYEPIQNFQPNMFHMNEIIPPIKQKGIPLPIPPVPEIPPPPPSKMVSIIEEHSRNEMKRKNPWITYKNEHYEDPEGHFRFYRTVQVAKFPPPDYVEEPATQMKRQVPTQYKPQIQYHNYPYEEATHPGHSNSTAHDSMYTSNLYLHQQIPSSTASYNPYLNYYNQQPYYTPTQYGVQPEIHSQYYSPQQIQNALNYQRNPYAVPSMYQQNLPSAITQQAALQNPLFQNPLYQTPQIPSMNILNNDIENLNSPQHEIDFWPALSSAKHAGDSETVTRGTPKALQHKTNENSFGDVPKENSNAQKYQPKEAEGEEKQQNFKASEYFDGNNKLNKFKDFKLFESQIADAKSENPGSETKMISPQLYQYLPQQKTPPFTYGMNSDNAKKFVFPNFPPHSYPPDIQLLKSWMEAYQNQQNVPKHETSSEPVAGIDTSSDATNKIHQPPSTLYQHSYQEPLVPPHPSNIPTEYHWRSPKQLFPPFSALESAVNHQIPASYTSEKQPHDYYHPFSPSPNVFSYIPNKTQIWENSNFPFSQVYRYPEAVMSYHNSVPATPGYSNPEYKQQTEEQSWYIKPDIKMNNKRQTTIPPTAPKEVHISSTFTEEIRETTTFTKATESPDILSSSNKPHRVSLPAGAKNIVIKLPNGEDIVVDIPVTGENTTKVSTGNNNEQTFPSKPTSNRQSYKRSFDFTDPIISSGELMFDSIEYPGEPQLFNHRFQSHMTPLGVSYDNAAASSVFSVASNADQPVNKLSSTASVGTTASPISNAKHFEKSSNTMGPETDVDSEYSDAGENNNNLLYDINNNILTISLFKDRHESNAFKGNGNKKENVAKKVTHQHSKDTDSLQKQSGESSSESSMAAEDGPQFNLEDLYKGINIDLPTLLNNRKLLEVLSNSKTGKRHGRHSRLPEASNCKCECN